MGGIPEIILTLAPLLVCWVSPQLKQRGPFGTSGFPQKEPNLSVKADLHVSPKVNVWLQSQELQVYLHCKFDKGPIHDCYRLGAATEVTVASSSAKV